MGHYVDFRDKIIELLQATQLDGSDAFAEVTSKPTNNFAGYPAATVLPSRVDSEFLTVAQNQRSYGFSVHLFYSLSGEAEWSDALEAVLRLVDVTLDELDQSIDLDGLCDFLQAVPAEWEVVTTTQDATSLVVVLNVVAIKSINVR